MRLCTFPECQGKYVARGYCAAHYRQYMAGNDLAPIIKGYHGRAAIDKFMAKVEELHPAKSQLDTACWVWIGSRNGNSKTLNLSDPYSGYASFAINGKQWHGHRWAWINIAGKTIHYYETLDHLCRITVCVNPDHLQSVSTSENTERMHLYKGLRGENERLRKLVTKLGYDPDTGAQLLD